MSAELWVENLAAYGLQAAALVLAGGALPWLLRLKHPRLLLVYWQVLLLACLALPAVQPWQHARVVEPEVVLGPVALVQPARPVTPPAAPLPWRQALLAALAAGCALRLAWIAVGLCRLHLYRRRARPLEPLPGLLRQAQAYAGAAPEMLVCPRISGPVTFGWARPVVLLPEWFLELAPARQAAIATHELLHVRRRDWAFTLAEELVRAVLWFHPAIWWLLSRIQLAREQVVDRETIELTRGRQEYLEALLEVARARPRAVAALAPLFFRNRHFTQRVKLLLQEVSMSRIRLSVSMAAIGAVAAITGGLAARAFPLQGAPLLELQAQAQSAPQGEPQAQRLRVGGNVQQRKLIHQEPPLYPPLAKQARIQGTVRFTATIAKDGTVKDLQLVSGHPLLVAAAQEAVRKWQYEPTVLNGRPVEVVTQIDLNFTLSGGVPGGAGPGVGPGEAHETVAPPPFASVEPEKGVKRIRVAPSDQEEKLLHRPAAMYPPLAQQAGVRGVVGVRLLIAVDGAVKAVQVVRGHPLLIPAATEAAKQYRFRPTTLDGQPAEVVTEVEVRVPAGEWPAASAAPPPEAELPPGVYKVGPAVSTPKLIRKIEPQYTEQARDAKHQGAVVLQVVVEEDGKIRQAKVLKSLGLGLDEKAVEAVKQWEFEPALRDGKPVKVQATIEINFRLN